MRKEYVEALTEEEHQRLWATISRGEAATRKLTHDRILLKAYQGEGG